MSVTVTVLMYSGRPNPGWELNDDEIEHLSGMLKSDRKFTNQISSASFGRLGYSGYAVVSHNDSRLPSHLQVFNGVVNINDHLYPNFMDEDNDVERFLLSTNKNMLTSTEISDIENQISQDTFRIFNSFSQRFVERSVPAFNPIKWNSDQDIMYSNNCYNYANDKITNTFAQPGRGSGVETELSCESVSKGAISDGQIPIDDSIMNSKPDEGHNIALVVWPGRDYHWYRLDKTGVWSERNMWSHKQGGTWAKNWDFQGLPIFDPRECDRGPYTKFCGFYHCLPDDVRIR